MTSVCFLSAAWRRFDVTRLVLEQRRRLCVDLAARGVEAASLVVADDENLDIARSYGCETVEAPNDRLGHKWNVGIQAAVATGCDWVVWIGSDDWVHPDVFDPIIDRPAGDPVIVSGSRLGIVDLRTGMLQRLSSPSQYGAIPWLVDARLLRAARAPIPPELPRGLDGALIRGIRLGRVNFTFEFHDPHDFRCVDFKTPMNITPYEGLAKNIGVGGHEPAWKALKGFFPADLLKQAQALVGHVDGLAAFPRAAGRVTPVHRAAPLRLVNPETGETATVSKAGYDVLAARGWRPAGQAA